MSITTPPAGPAGSRTPAPILRRLRVRLSLVFVLFLLLVVGVGLFSLDRLGNFHGVASQISGRWLQTNSILGDLNDNISDLRGLEGELLTARSANDLRAAVKEISGLDEEIARSEARYGRVEHDAAELALYHQFTAQWADYRKLAGQVIALMHDHQTDEAIALYYHESTTAFNQADATLGMLTKRNAEGIDDAVRHEGTAYRNARRLIMASIMVAGCLLIAAVAYIVNSVTNPIARLVECMHRIADNDTSVEVTDAARRDEIGDVAKAVVRFRDNTIELARSKEALASKTVALQETLAKERRLADLQRNFVSMASHEFRAPLNIIDGHAQRLLRTRDTLTPESVAERCGKIRDAVHRMTDLIDHLLDSAETLDRALPGAVRRLEFSLPTLLHEVCEMHRESTPAAQIRETLGADVPEVFHGDAKLLFQAISNLVGNAIKYSPPGSPVLLEASVQGDRKAVEISVTDQGIGVPARDIEHLFDRYVRGSNVTTTAGAGVGLYLVKLAVELHRGVVRVESTEGDGSRFTVLLPLDSQPERGPDRMGQTSGQTR